MKTSDCQQDSFARTSSKKTWLRSYVPGLYLFLFVLWCVWVPLQIALYGITGRPIDTSFLLGRRWWGALIEFAVSVVLIGIIPCDCGMSMTRVAWNDTQASENMFATWQVKNADCPPSINELSKAVGKKSFSNKDPWGTNYTLVCPGLHEADIDVCSNGPDKQPNTTDDICNWQPKPR